MRTMMLGKSGLEVPVMGSMTPERIREAARGADVMLSRTEWYDIFKAAGFKLP